MMAFKNFLGCFQVETGGIVIGFLSFVINLLSLFSFSIFFIGSKASGVPGCQAVNKFLSHLSHMDIDVSNIFACYVLVSVILLFFFISAIISFLCVKGVENRGHVRVRPLMIYYGILTAISFLGLICLFMISENGIQIALAVLTLFIGYIFSVLNSLFDIFHKEFLNGSATHYHDIPMINDPSSSSAPEKIRTEDECNSPC